MLLNGLNITTLTIIYHNSVAKLAKQNLALALTQNCLVGINTNWGGVECRYLLSQLAARIK